MRDLVKTNQFKKDYKKAKKQGRDLSKLQKVLTLLMNGSDLDYKYHDHPLTGRWVPCRDCHIEPDWILIYRLTDDNELVLVRMGSHSELFR